jgi:hypothetical protein
VPCSLTPRAYPGRFSREKIEKITNSSIPAGYPRKKYRKIEKKSNKKKGKKGKF